MNVILALESSNTTSPFAKLLDITARKNIMRYENEIKNCCDEIHNFHNALLNSDNFTYFTNCINSVYKTIIPVTQYLNTMLGYAIKVQSFIASDKIFANNVTLSGDDYVRYNAATNDTDRFAILNACINSPNKCIQNVQDELLNEINKDIERIQRSICKAHNILERESKILESPLYMQLQDQQDNELAQELQSCVATSQNKNTQEKKPKKNKVKKDSCAVKRGVAADDKQPGFTFVINDVGASSHITQYQPSQSKKDFQTNRAKISLKHHEFEKYNKLAKAFIEDSNKTRPALENQNECIKFALSFISIFHDGNKTLVKPTKGIENPCKESIDHKEVATVIKLYVKAQQSIKELMAIIIEAQKDDFQLDKYSQQKSRELLETEKQMKEMPTLIKEFLQLLPNVAAQRISNPMECKQSDKNNKSIKEYSRKLSEFVTENLSTLNSSIQKIVDNFEDPDHEIQAVVDQDPDKELNDRTQAIAESAVASCLKEPTTSREQYLAM